MSREPIRLLHFADLHIGMENYGRLDPSSGLNQRVLDFVSRLKEVVDYAIEHEADLVIFAGDAFKTRDPNPTYQRAFARQVMRLSRAGIPTVLLLGNHDMPIIEQRASSLDIFSALEVPNVIVGRAEAVHRIQTRRGTLQVATVPWPQRNRLLKFEEYRGMTVEQLDQEMVRIWIRRSVGWPVSWTPACQPSSPATSRWMGRCSALSATSCWAATWFCR